MGAASLSRVEDTILQQVSGPLPLTILLPFVLRLSPRLSYRGYIVGVPDGIGHPQSSC